MISISIELRAFRIGLEFIIDRDLEAQRFKVPVFVFNTAVVISPLCIHSYRFCVICEFLPVIIVPSDGKTIPIIRFNNGLQRHLCSGCCQNIGRISVFSVLCVSLQMILYKNTIINSLFIAVCICSDTSVTLPARDIGER